MDILKQFEGKINGFFDNILSFHGAQALSAVFATGSVILAINGKSIKIYDGEMAYA